MTFQPRCDPAEVIALNAQGLTQKEIGRRVGIHQSSVSDLLKRHGVKACRKPGPRRIYTLNERYFEDIHAPEQAYWLGFLAADGYQIPGRSPGINVRLARVDVGHLQLLADALGSDKTPKIQKDGAATITFHSRRLATDLTTYGVTQRKTWTCVPWDAPANLAPHYWRGLIDGDGHIRTAHGMQVVFVGTLAMVEGFKSFAAAICGTEAAPRQQIGCWKLTVQGRRQVHALLSALYREDWVGLARKKQPALSVIAEPYRPLRFRKSCRICGDPAVARLLCGKHWQRWRANGDPLVTRLARGADGRFRAA